MQPTLTRFFLSSFLTDFLEPKDPRTRLKTQCISKRILRFCLSAFGLLSSSLCTNSKFVDGVVLSIILYVSWQMLPDIFNLLVHLSFCVIKLFRFLNQSLLLFSKSNCLLLCWALLREHSTGNLLRSFVNQT